MTNDERVRRLTDRVEGFYRLVRTVRLILFIVGVVLVAWVIWRVM